MRPEETDAVAQLTVEVYVGGGYSTPAYAARLADVATRARETEVLVAVDDGGAPGGEVLGAVSLAVAGSPYAEQAEPGEAVFRMLAVRPTARGRGVGEALVRACVERSRALGCHRLRLSTQPEMAAAHRLYDRLGFVRTPASDWSPEPGVALRTYALDLDPPVRPPDPGGAARR